MKNDSLKFGPQKFAIFPGFHHHRQRRSTSKTIGTRCGTVSQLLPIGAFSAVVCVVWKKNVTFSPPHSIVCHNRNGEQDRWRRILARSLSLSRCPEAKAQRKHDRSTTATARHLHHSYSPHTTTIRSRRFSQAKSFLLACSFSLFFGETKRFGHQSSSSTVT